MLVTLRIVNLGAVDEAVLELEPGLTVLTGETGVGKTLLVEALHLVLGGADRGVPARDTGAPGRVEALFDDGDEIVLVRERTSSGRLRATVDGDVVSARTLADRAAPLCELHGQHEHQVLRASGAARALLDRAGGIDDADVRRLRARRTELHGLRDRLGGDAAARRRRLELLCHEVAEIEAESIEGADEVDRLLAEAATVAAVLDARDSLQRAVGLLEDDGDAPTATGMLTAAVAQLPRRLEARRDEATALLEGTRELARALRADLDAAEADPERLDALNARIGVLQALVRKHGTSLDDVLLAADALTAERDRLAADEARSAELDDELASLEAALAESEAVVAAAREAAAVTLAAGVQARLAPLALPHARFAVDVDGPAGERVAFRFAGSSAFEPSPLAEAASGGELSRVMLALTLATGATAPCVVFDEVDAGVGGVTARALASCLAELAASRQVLVVTHLATVAAAAANHLVVTRAATADGPAQVVVASGEARVREIARMLAGDPDDPVAREHASALLAGDPAVA